MGSVNSTFLAGTNMKENSNWAKKKEEEYLLGGMEVIGMEIVMKVFS